MKYHLTLWGLCAALAFNSGCASTCSSCGAGGGGARTLAHHQGVLPPAEMLMHPGPGVDGPGPGVIPPFMPAAMPGMGVAMTSQIAFARPDGMQVTWDVGAPGMFDSQPLVTPARYNFPQGAIYRLKLANIPGRPGVELYPTLEVGPARARSEAYLAHNAIPCEFTEEDLDQVLTGNFVTKVIYLPNAEYQELAVAGVETLVSTRLDPGVDPVVEADRRGTIMAIVRLGNKDLQAPGARMAGGGIVQASHQVPLAFGPASCGGCNNPAAMQGGGPMMQGGSPMMQGGMPGYGGMQGYMPGYGGAIPPAYVAGVTSPAYGMPSVGTPIGLPGPPHIPLGVPAGLRCEVMNNHTCVDLPCPTPRVQIDVQEKPGLAYPKPVSHVRITEESAQPPCALQQPYSERVQVVPGAAGCPQ